MPKSPIKEVLARNLRSLMERGKLHQKDLAARAQLSESHLSEILRCISAATIEKVADLATALGVQPWELLADSEATRQAAMHKLMWGTAVADSKVEKHLPLPPDAPVREPAPPRKKSRGAEGSAPPRAES